MDRVNRLLASPAYREYLQRIEEKEVGRPFCPHHFHHCLDVARLCWIFFLEEGIDGAKDVVYGAALLHDIGRWLEYEGGGCHAARGAELADPLLAQAGYDEGERRLIINAIAAHRGKVADAPSSPLSVFLQKADKYSRLCFQCTAWDDCYKRDEMPQGRQLLY